jgi:hypothetical protein
LSPFRLRLLCFWGRGRSQAQRAARRRARACGRSREGEGRVEEWVIRSSQTRFSAAAAFASHLRALLASLPSHSSFPPPPLLSFAIFFRLPSLSLNEKRTQTDSRCDAQVSTGPATSTEWRIVDVGGSRSQVSAPFSRFFWCVFSGGGGGIVNRGCLFIYFDAAPILFFFLSFLHLLVRRANVLPSFLSAVRPNEN